MSRYSFISVVFLLLVSSAVAQKVGIGTTTPTSTLEIKNPNLSVLKISSTKYSDTSQLIFSNRTNIAGTDMLITSIKELGLRITSASDLADQTNDSILSITPNGRVGINKNIPVESLDVNGSINLTENLKIDGSPGAPGQVLSVNNIGQNEWTDMGEYKNNRMVTSTFSSTISVPAGVTRMLIEQWGGGGGGGDVSGGASGCYARFLFDASKVTSFTIVNGGGGAGQTSATGDAGDGTASTLTTNLSAGGSATYTIYGGMGAKFSSIGQPRIPIIYPTGTVLLFYVALPGKRGKIVQLSNNYRYMGDGGDAVMGLSEGGAGSYVYYDYNNPGTARFYSQSYFGIYSSGGGGGWGNFPIASRGAAGGNGVTILRW
jgi:hypothetical protein